MSDTNHHAGADDCGTRPCRDRACRYRLPNGQCLWDVLEQNPDGMSLEQIGEVFGITRQAIEQIQHRALEKVRRRMNRTGAVDPFSGAIDPWGK